MKKFLFILAAMIPVSADAQSPQSMRLCPLVGELAGDIMKARQIGMPKDTVIGTISSGPTYRLSMYMVDFVYNIPIASTEQMKSTLVESFRMQAEYICYRNFTY